MKASVKIKSCKGNRSYLGLEHAVEGAGIGAWFRVERNGITTACEARGEGWWLDDRTGGILGIQNEGEVTIEKIDGTSEVPDLQVTLPSDFPLKSDMELRLLLINRRVCSPCCTVPLVFYSKCYPVEIRCTSSGNITPQTKISTTSAAKPVPLVVVPPISSPGAYLVQGPSGTGKTHLCDELCKANQSRSISLTVPELFRRASHGGTAAVGVLIREVFKRYSVVVIEGVDRLILDNPVARVAGLQLATELSKRVGDANCITVGTCGEWRGVESILRGPSAFSSVITLSPPTTAERAKLVAQQRPDLDTEQVGSIARATPSYLPAQLKNILTHSDPFSQLSSIASEASPTVPLHGAALPEGVPPWMWGYFSHLSNVSSITKTIHDVLVAPLIEGSRPVKGILFHGEPGTGKTELAACVARLLTDVRSASQKIEVFGKVECVATSIISKVVGGSEGNIKQLFDKARSAAPCVLLIDQFEALAVKRGLQTVSKSLDRTLSTLLTEMDGVAGDPTAPPVIVLACTSQKDLLDPAVLRSGRLDIHIRTPESNAESLLPVLSTHLLPFAPADAHAELSSLFSSTLSNRLFTYADIHGVINETKMNALRRALRSSSEPSVSVGDYKTALGV
eukprot:TRINITY_DN24239_c0_g1_i1.p1 TRINITY_DN24239_c0_g1~~TRINITY_DN24239_c0_g1_i1.p1  ORF type:complete len:637 (+),score=103.79 TRINITY_DN24239_c0_g1_i1:42-1913(+)